MNFCRSLLSLFPLVPVFALGCGGLTLDAGGGYTPPPEAGATPTSDARADAGTPAQGVIPAADASTAGDGTASPCAEDSDCAFGDVCVWPLGGNWCIALNPPGTCVTGKRLPCDNSLPTLLLLGCGCDGQTVVLNPACGVAAPPGYLPVGIANEGPCAPIGTPDLPDASSPPSDAAESAAPACRTDADCPRGGYRCGYSVYGSCAATGPQCILDASGGQCSMGDLACTCDGTTVVLGCTTVGGSPLAHPGPCAGSDAAF